MPYIPISLSQLLASPSFSPHPHPLRHCEESDHLLTRFTKLAQSIAYQTLSAISYLHDEARKIAHRDIKPNNILLTPDGCVKLIDFGIVWTESESKSDLNAQEVWPEQREKMYFEVSTGYITISLSSFLGPYSFAGHTAPPNSSSEQGPMIRLPSTCGASEPHLPSSLHLFVCWIPIMLPSTTKKAPMSKSRNHRDHSSLHEIPAQTHDGFGTPSSTARAASSGWRGVSSGCAERRRLTSGQYVS